MFVGNVLIHLADPARALRALRGVIAPGGELLSLEATSLALDAAQPAACRSGQLWDFDDQPRWWTPNRAAHRRWLHAAGYEVLARAARCSSRSARSCRAWPTPPPR